MDSNPRRLQLRVTLTAALLVVPGHRAPPPGARCSVLALWSSSTGRRNPGRCLNRLGCQGLGGTRATTLQTTRCLTMKWLEIPTLCS